ncbi:ethanolamine ammonia-lyase reactivating factor EutA [Alteribacillus sp. YIM 98480]|uniref:ethanolamine ammonia-lyase reactivating factor EutA n=1 Tax=Alteribacillus sp. YIM 98480 TaxID=2606599 RepID=UPI0021049181|nr:ethanolamine ammonia-lyase reactivating factor EutA [Alteribacillus sp. YIM 98480]
MGLDVGTSTTKFIVSRLLIENRGNSFTLPACQIMDRSVIYASQMYKTPLITEYEIDINRLSDILAFEYKQAGLMFENVQAGAVIITGETAQKQNAQTIINYLAERAGDFVVATAGADLEGILAGKGSGAKKRSEETEGVVANIDIGGGTANAALFQNGKAIRTLTFHVGGRLIRLTEQGEIKYISNYIRPWLQANRFDLQVGHTVSFELLKEVCLCMSKSMLSYFMDGPITSAEKLLFSSISSPLPQLKEIIFSGNIGKMIHKKEPDSFKEVAKFGDIGPMLAYTLNLIVKESSLFVKLAKETSRATVIGAGMQNTELSGATVFVNEQLLPLKNIPILNVFIDSEKWESQVFKVEVDKVMKQAKQLFVEKKDPPFALGLSGLEYCSYKMLQSIAADICTPFKKYFPYSNCMVVICENDMAKAMGQALKIYSSEGMQIMSIDQVDFTYGDYIDLGLPAAGEAISITVKTLAFG